MKNKTSKNRKTKALNKHVVLSSAVKLPPHFRLGKEKTNGIMIGGLPMFSSVAQIFLRCAGNEKKCHDTIALIPTTTDGNDAVNKVTDAEAGKIFDAQGWLVKGYNNSDYTRCPVCRLNITNVRFKQKLSIA